MQSGCTVPQLLPLCMSQRSPKCCRMARRLSKGEGFAFNTTVLEMRRVFVTMWTFILLHSIYFAVTFAQTTSPEICPRTCECSAVEVKCKQRGLTEIPKNLSKDVTILDLSGNDISLIKSDGFLQFSKLHELNLSHNKIADVSMLGKLPKSLQNLYLRGNRLKTLSGKWSQFIKLDFSENKIRRISNVTFQNCRGLKELYLSNNKITTIDRKSFSQTSLQKLKLDGNRLTTIPNLELKNLATLDLSRNLLEKISYEFVSLKSLKSLHLSSNKIKSIKDAAFYTLHKLKRIYLDSNLLTSWNGNWLYNLKELRNLNLQNNKIRNISSKSWDKSWLCCSKLQTLNFANNNLGRILVDKARGDGGRFAELRSLIFLNLSSNGILEVSDNAFGSLENLRVLDMNDNKLSWTSYDTNGTFKGLKNLEKLYLRKNEISSVLKLMFVQLPSLRKLEMTSNPIEEIAKDAFSPLENLEDLRMNTHSLYCGCKLQWFSRWLKSKTFPHLSTLKCREPRRLFQRDFTSVQSDDLICDSSRLEITEHPKSKIALEGNEVQLSCTVKNGSIDGIKIIWKKDMKNIDSNHSDVTKITQVTDENFRYYRSVLRLFDVNGARDGGYYQCVVLTKIGERKSRKARLDVYVPPRFTSKPKNMVTTLGSDVRFNCSASGVPQPKVYFTKKADLSILVNQRRVGLDGETFIIRNVTFEDVGLYWCVAKSKAGLINTTFQVNVRGKPVVVHPMLDKVALLHDSVMFMCATKGWPTPKYLWLKDGEPIDLTSTSVQHRRELNAEYLIILSAKYSDAGEYKCRVSNTLGTTELTSRLKVVEDLSSKNTTTSGATLNEMFIAAIVSICVCTLVVIAFIYLVIRHFVRRRGSGLCSARHKTPEIVTMDTYASAMDGDHEEFIQIAENSPNDSPRSSSTFVTSDSHTPSDSNYLQTSGSDNGSTNEHREGSFDGRQSSGVCSMNSSTSSLASATATNHRNTFPFSNNPKTYYPGCSYDASDDSASVGIGSHQPPKQTLLVKCVDPHPPSRRKYKSSRSRDRHVCKRQKKQESESLCSRHIDDNAGSTTEEYGTTTETTST